MRKIISIVLVCLLFCLQLSACKKTNTPAESAPNTVVGQWTTSVDMTDTVYQMVHKQIDAEIAAFDFSVILLLSLQQDGTYTVTIDHEALDNQLDQLGDVFWQTVVDQAQAQSQLSADETIQALQNQGKSKELLMQQLDLASLFENSYAENGVWKEENGTLYLARNEELLKNAEGYPYSLDDSLSITYTALNENQETIQKMVVFTRVK